jgi:hypothetical protein
MMKNQVYKSRYVTRYLFPLFVVFLAFPSSFVLGVRRFVHRSLIANFAHMDALHHIHVLHQKHAHTQTQQKCELTSSA